jgi:hypothetical protein
MGRDSSVGVATRLRAGWMRNRYLTRAKDFSLLHNVQTGSRANLSSSKIVGKRQEREADRLPSPSADVKNSGVIP